MTRYHSQTFARNLEHRRDIHIVRLPSRWNLPTIRDNRKFRAELSVNIFANSLSYQRIQM